MRAFGERYAEFRQAGAVVIGVSADSAERQRAFRESLGVNMPLIADTDKAIATLYDAKEFIGVIPARLTYVIDTAGIIRSVGTHRVHMDRHSSEALTVVQELAAAAEPETQQS